ncbi:MAG: DUF3048 domain-containing protein [Anaerolineales bacterium]
MSKMRPVPFLLLIILLAACGQPRAIPAQAPETETPAAAAPASPEDTATHTPVPATTATPSETASPPMGNPLTGVPLEDAARLDQRPILVKVSNFPRNNRPQWGLSLADIVFEHYAEGGLTRFSALFFGQEAETIGPIRSARFVDLELVQMYGAIFAYGSADFRVREAIAESNFAERAVTEYPARCPPMCRFDPSNLNHLITSTAGLREYLQDQGVADQPVDLAGMKFDRVPPSGGEPGTELEIHYSAGNFHSWRYEAEAGVYRRWQETGSDEAEVELFSDRLTGAPVGPSNVILVVVPHSYITPNPEFVRIELWGSGRAIAFRDGRAFEIRWVRPAGGGVLRFEMQDGSSFPLKPGSTWIELVNTSSEIVEREPASWWVRFHIP